jgi:uncharacterized protein
VSNNAASQTLFFTSAIFSYSYAMNAATSMSTDLTLARDIANRVLAGTNAKAILFGSRARGDARQWSDIDLAIESKQALLPEILSALREAFEDSNILLNVDVVDLRDASVEIRNAVLREGVPWID